MGLQIGADDSQARVPVIPLVFHFCSCLRVLAFVGKPPPIRDKTCWMESAPLHLCQIYKPQKEEECCLLRLPQPLRELPVGSMLRNPNLDFDQSRMRAAEQKQEIDVVHCAVAGESVYV